MIVAALILMGAGIVTALAAALQPLCRKRPRRYTQEALICIFGPMLFMVPAFILLYLGRPNG